MIGTPDFADFTTPKDIAEMLVQLLHNSIQDVVKIARSTVCKCFVKDDAVSHFLGKMTTISTSGHSSLMKTKR